MIATPGGAKHRNIVLRTFIHWGKKTEYGEKKRDNEDKSDGNDATHYKNYIPVHEVRQDAREERGKRVGERREVRSSMRMKRKRKEEV